jgi:hypothetical protein
MTDETEPKHTNSEAGPQPSVAREGAVNTVVDRVTASPYEDVLNKAFDKLTSQVLIFLLAYMILLIGVAVLGNGIDSGLRTLFYIIPIMGVAGYIWLQRWRHVSGEEDSKRDVDVRGHVTRGGSEVVGERGRVSDRSGSTKVRSGLASDKSRVVGRDVPGSGGEDPTIPRDLIDIYHELDRGNRGRLLTYAQNLLSRQQPHNG